MELEQAEIVLEDMLRSEAQWQAKKDKFMGPFSKGVRTGFAYCLEVLGYEDIPQEVLRRFEEESHEQTDPVERTASTLIRRWMMPGSRAGGR